jgi:hypothetical protein
VRLTWPEIRANAALFAMRWRAAVSERADKQTFYNEFFEVFGIRRASVAVFEENVCNLGGHTDAIDLFWRGKLLAEHKSRGASLDHAASQAFRYIESLAREGRHDEIPRFVMVSDFANFTLYDLEPDEQRDLPLFAGLPLTRADFTLSEFPDRVRNFAFMLGRANKKSSLVANQKAYRRMCDLHDALKRGGFSGHDLERLLVRVLFCLFAEDTFIFEPEAFTRFIRDTTAADGANLGAQLNMLFDWLNNPAADGELDDTDPFNGFRYVNGGLFAERLGFPRCDQKMRDALLECCEFHWAAISPAVFGSLFQGVMEPGERRQLGAHYTGERDILRVVNSLFLDELQADWQRAKRDRSTRRRAGLNEFHQRLRSLQFLDPACGCGNFLVLAYRELRLLELEVVKTLADLDRQQLLPVVNVDQFHGIEILEWPARIAEVAMWLMDHQMNQQAGEQFGRPIDRLPLTTSPHIVHSNALTLDWAEILPPSACSYILGNPPFVGKHLMTGEQTQDMQRVFGTVSGVGVLDYVTAWYVKAARYMQKNRTVSAAFVSTNSVSQGEQPGVLWPLLFSLGVKIHFAHRTFQWSSEAPGKAHVHCVIIGFGLADRDRKKIYDYTADNDQPDVSVVDNINPYLVEAADLVLPSRSAPICNVPSIIYGNKPADGGHLIIEESDYSAFIKANPTAKPCVRPLICAEEYLHGQRRYCLWLAGAPPAIIAQNPGVKSRIQACKDFRLASKKASTREAGKTPSLFMEIRQPHKTYILIPLHTSETRAYIPFGYFTPKTIVHNSCTAIPNATLYHFGVLSSAMHLAWVKQVCGRLKSDFRYSNKLVYNNYPWPTPSASQREKIEYAAQAVLDARENYPTSTLADLYDPLTMPPPLVKAHTALDAAVDRSYRKEKFDHDRQRVEFLFTLHQQLTAPLTVTHKKKHCKQAIYY